MTRPEPTRSIVAASALLVGLAVLSACSEAERGAGDAAEIELWTISLRPTFDEYMGERIATYESANPGVSVRWVDVPFMAIERKLIAAAAADRAPDVINLSDMMFARFAAAGAFRDLSELMPAETLEAYHPGALAVGGLGEGSYALPWYLTTQAMIVNEPLLAEGGLSAGGLPETWRGLMGLARSYREETGRFLFTQPLGTDSQLPRMLLAEGLAPFRLGEDGLVKPDLTRLGVADYLAEWVALYRDGAMPRESATRGFEHLIDVYQNERVAVVNTGANFLARVRDASRRVYDASVVRPPATGDLGRAHIAVMPVSVSSRSEHPGVAADFAAFLTGPESQLLFCRLAPILPSTGASLEDEFFAGPTAAEEAEGLAKVGAARAVVADALRRGAPFTPALEAWPAMRRVFNEGIKAALLDGADVGETLAGIEAEWGRLIDEMNERRVASGARPAGVEVLEALPGARAAALSRSDGGGP